MKNLKALLLSLIAVFVLLSCKKKDIKPKNSTKFMLTYECIEQPNRLAEILDISYYDTSGNLKNTSDFTTNQFNVTSPIVIHDIDLAKPISILAYSVYSIGVEGGGYGVVDLKPGIYRLYLDGSLVDTKYVDAVEPNGANFPPTESDGFYHYDQ